MSVVKFCVGKMTIPFFTDITIYTKILGHIIGNAQRQSQCIQAASFLFNMLSVSNKYNITICS